MKLLGLILGTGAIAEDPVKCRLITLAGGYSPYNPLKFGIKPANPKKYKVFYHKKSTHYKVKCNNKYKVEKYWYAKPSEPNYRLKGVPYIEEGDTCRVKCLSKQFTGTYVNHKGKLKKIKPGSITCGPDGIGVFKNAIEQCVHTQICSMNDILNVFGSYGRGGTCWWGMKNTHYCKPSCSDPSGNLIPTPQVQCVCTYEKCAYYLKDAKRKYVPLLSELGLTMIPKCDKCTRSCSQYYHPICGSNGETYINTCRFTEASCHNPKITKKYDGECRDCNRACTMEYNPVCGSDGKTYSNMCIFNNEQCRNASLRVDYPGECCAQQAVCTMIYAPECGTDGVTYSNHCLLEQASCLDPTIKLDHTGQCMEATGCIVPSDAHGSWTCNDLDEDGFVKKGSSCDLECDTAESYYPNTRANPLVSAKCISTPGTLANPGIPATPAGYAFKTMPECVYSACVDSQKHAVNHRFNTYNYNGKVITKLDYPNGWPRGTVFDATCPENWTLTRTSWRYPQNTTCIAKGTEGRSVWEDAKVEGCLPGLCDVNFNEVLSSWPHDTTNIEKVECEPGCVVFYNDTSNLTAEQLLFHNKAKMGCECKLKTKPGYVFDKTLTEYVSLGVCGNYYRVRMQFDLVYRLDPEGDGDCDYNENCSHYPKPIKAPITQK